MFDNKRILITGGTGSLGRTLVQRLLTGDMGIPQKIIVFSRDEAKQHQMQVYHKNIPILKFHIGDIRDMHSIASALKDADIVFNAAALKQVPACEYHPYEAVMTNINGAENIVKAIREYDLPVETVVGISTDKACKPVNTMGMTKAVQERIFINANLSCAGTRFICVRYGNVLNSRGSVIPLFIDQIRLGGPVTITTMDMTRFLISLDKAVDTIFAAVKYAMPGEIYVPKIHSANVVDIVDILIGKRKIEKVITGIRPGEKIHEVLISETEYPHTVNRGDYYAIQSVLPELQSLNTMNTDMQGEYDSAKNLMSFEELSESLKFLDTTAISDKC